MHDSGGADTCGCEMLITSAVAIVFSCSEGDTYSLRVPCSIGRAIWALVMKKLQLNRVTSQRLALGITANPNRKFRNSIGRNRKDQELPAAFPDYIPCVEEWMGQ